MVSVSQMTCTINKHLGPLREIGPLFNKPAPGIQTVFETIFLPRLTSLYRPFLYLAPCGKACPALPSPFVWQVLGGWAGSPGERSAVLRRGRMRGAHTGSLACTTAGESPVGQAWDSRRWAGSLSLHSQTSQVGGYSSTGAPKWPTSASESTAFSVGLVIAYRREKRKNQACSQLAAMWHLLLWAEWKRI